MRPASLNHPGDVSHEHADPRKTHDTRTEFERDRSRILHSESFRRLQEKTQVFYGFKGASFRTRLTHSMEVALIAKALARKFDADADLCEAIALGHDLGHPPFGHNGESVLNDCMREHGGFEGNAQALRIVRCVEVKGFRYEGLNLTYATLDGLLKYKRRWSEARTGSQQTAATASLLRAESHEARDLEAPPSAPKCVYDEDWDLVQAVVAARGSVAGESFECRILNLADDIAYCVADLQDGLRMGFVSMEEIRRASRGEGFAPEILAFVRLEDPEWQPSDVTEALESVVRLYDAIVDKGSTARLPRTSAQFVRLASSKELASKLHREFVHAVTLRAGELPSLDPAAAAKVAVLKAVTRTQTLKDPRLTTLDAASRRVVRRLFEAYANDPGLLPRGVSERVRSSEFAPREKLRLVCDHIASLSDDGAVAAYRRLFEPGSQGLLDFYA
jgi:dGTPase